MMEGHKVMQEAPRQPRPPRTEIHVRYLVLLDKLQKARAMVET